MTEQSKKIRDKQITVIEEELISSFSEEIEDDEDDEEQPREKQFKFADSLNQR